MARINPNGKAARGSIALLGIVVSAFSLSEASSPERDRLGELPTLPPPLCRSASWVEERAQSASRLGEALAAGEVDEELTALGTALSTEGWECVPSLIAVWRGLDLEDDGQASTGAALATWFNGLALGSTLDWDPGLGPANRDAVADLYGVYLDARMRSWPELGDESNPTLLKARVWVDDLLREGASRTEVRDARQGIGDAEWEAAPAVLEGIARLGLEQAAGSKQVKGALRLMERFPGAPDGTWSEGTGPTDRLSNLKLLEDYLAATLSAPLREIELHPRPPAVSKREWSGWERAAQGLLEDPSDPILADELVEQGSQARGPILNALLGLDVLDGDDYASGMALDQLLRRLAPETTTPPWIGPGDTHPAIAARSAILAWHGGRSKASGTGVAGTSSGGKFGGRGGGRRRLASEGGQPIATAIGDGLLWLASNQRSNGSWSAYPWTAEDGKPLGYHEVGLTGLALLAFVADGQADGDALYNEATRRAVDWLISTQRAGNGTYGDRRGHDWIYDHAIATQALAEFAAQTGDSRVIESVAAAARLLEEQQLESGGWSYDKSMEGGDTSVTTWAVSALAAARTADVPVDPVALERAYVWYDSLTDPETGRAGYRDPGTPSARIIDVNDDIPPEHTEALSAAALWASLVCPDEPEITPRVQGYAKLLGASPPAWEEHHIDFYYWYWGALATWQLGEKSPWDTWDKSLRKALLPSQRQDGKFKGSWDPVGPWCAPGRRVYSTAMGILILETYYRYERLVR